MRVSLVTRNLKRDLSTSNIAGILQKISPELIDFVGT